MNITINASRIAYRIQEHVELLESDDGITAISPLFQITISPLSPCQRSIMMELTKTPCSMQWIHARLQEANEEKMLKTFYRYLSCLIRYQMASISVGDEEKEIATLFPISPYFQHSWVTLQTDQPYQLSRFAYIRRDEDGSPRLESPLSHARIRLDQPIAAAALYQLNSAMTPLKFTRAFPEEDVDTLTNLLALLVMGGFVSPTTSDERLSEDDDETLMQWEFHDLLFHNRSREGRHDNPAGGTYRFLDSIPPQPAVKRAQWSATIPLPRPDMDTLKSSDLTLTAVLEGRASIRDYGDGVLTIDQLGEFLYRVARVKEIYADEESGDFTKRPYPSGGANYEMELYLTIDQCEGLVPGLYWYDPLNHALAHIRELDKETERLLLDAHQAIGGSTRPPVLITLAARFQRVAWKYQSIAYALILKDVGAIYSTMYLVATAMNLAPCAIGAGDSDLFARLADTDYLKETSVGEFALGPKPEA